MAEDEDVDSEDEDLIDIAQQADLIQAERMVEDGSRDEGGGRKKGDADAVRAVEKDTLAINLDADVISAGQSQQGFEVCC